MTSERKIRANRANARASTGPKTALARARVARNALRHGLSLPIYLDAALCKEVEAVAREIVGADVNHERKELARRIAEAQIDLRRVRHARQQLFFETLRDLDMESAAVQHNKSAAILRCMPISGADASKPDGMMNLMNSKPEGSHKLATILSEKAPQLLALDRYERRALSRRKFAIRAFDLLRSS